MALCATYGFVEHKKQTFIVFCVLHMAVTVLYNTVITCPWVTHIIYFGYVMPKVVIAKVRIDITGKMV